MNPEKCSWGRAEDKTKGAFTLLELLVVLAVIACGLAMLAPALTTSGPGSQVARCQNNLRQLAVAWQAYASDNSDNLVIMLQGNDATGGIGDQNLGVGWAEGWFDWTTSTDNTNVNFLINDHYARLARYVNGSTNVFKCPSDRYLSGIQRSIGWSQRVRSYSGNVYIGAGNAEKGPADVLYKHVTQMSQFINPAPSESWLFLEEHPDSINDPAFFSPSASKWWDVPATHHNGACGFSFVDGHTELHRWQASLTAGIPSVVSLADMTSINVPVGDADIHWMSYHCIRKSSASY